MTPVQLYDIPSIASVDEVLEKLDDALAFLESECADSMKTADDKRIMKGNIGALKMYYERAERLLLDEQAMEVFRGS